MGDDRPTRRRRLIHLPETTENRYYLEYGLGPNVNVEASTDESAFGSDIRTIIGSGNVHVEDGDEIRELRFDELEADFEPTHTDTFERHGEYMVGFISSIYSDEEPVGMVMVTVNVEEQASMFHNPIDGVSTQIIDIGEQQVLFVENEVAVLTQTM